ncbi:hypothetical protein [Notoacmeibacter marinus]|uniref:hypothetical protein n=1 Tax=Notoacmeibacter marinus TaxID=1876515 RepID=UPI0013B06929|nr:hypothetical protein [Notoacmeibacter marinus]
MATKGWDVIESGTPIDVTIVSGARPTLLKRTIESFAEGLFRYFPIQTAYVNIDPFEGGPDEVAECSQIVREHFSDVRLRTPGSPGFAAAVKWLWSNVQAPYALHLEDDWLLNELVRPQQIAPLFSDQIRQIAFIHKDKQWRFKSRIHLKSERVRLFGISMGRRLLRNRPLFTTSPAFVEREFANKCSGLMLENLDPEKQLYSHRHPTLSNYTSNYHCYLYGDFKKFIITDIGRDHRKTVGLNKGFENGQSVWR